MRDTVTAHVDLTRSPPRSDPREAGRWLREQLGAAEDCGYFGPDSAIWLLHQEALLGVGLGRAVLLQLAHPWVAQAVADHSAFYERPLDRLVATITAAELLVFGSRRQADAAAARLRHVHEQINGTLHEDVGRWRAGTPYRAADPAALLWVLATLIDTTLRVYEAGLGRLPEEIVRAYCADAARLGAMLGIAAETVPRDRAALAGYIETMIDSGTVAVGPRAREIATALRHARVLPGLQWRTYSSITHAVAATTLPRALQAQYGPLLTLRRRPLYRAAGLAGRAVLPRLPRYLRRDPIAAVAIRRAKRTERCRAR